MFRFLLGMLCLLVPHCVFSQVEGWLYFADKPHAEEALQSPQTFLTERAIARRTLNAIPVDAYDVPIYSPYIDAIAAVPTVEILAQSNWLNGLYLRFDEVILPEILAKLGVLKLQFSNHTVALPFQIEENVSQNQAEYGGSELAIHQMNLQALHDLDKWGDQVWIAVIDNGFTRVDSIAGFGHLFSQNQVLDTYHFVNRTSDVFQSGTHGTMVLSTLAALSPNEIMGGAPEAMYALYVTEDTQREMPIEPALWIEAAERADRLGVDIITTSLGYTTFDQTDYSYAYEMLDGEQVPMSKAASIAASRGIIVINSAGNSGNSSFPWMSAAADGMDVLAVGAVDANIQRAGFSSIGPTADGRLKPELMALGVGNPVYNAVGEIQHVNGTSFSAPWVAAGFACLRQALPAATVAQLQEWVLATASNSNQPDNNMGYGIPDFGQAYLLGQAALSTPTFSFSPTWTIAPVPFNSNFTVQTAAAVSFQMEIVDATGRSLYSTYVTDSSVQVPTENWAHGVYYVRFISELGQQTQTIIK